MKLFLTILRENCFYWTCNFQIELRTHLPEGLWWGQNSWIGRLSEAWVSWYQPHRLLFENRLFISYQAYRCIFFGIICLWLDDYHKWEICIDLLTCKNVFTELPLINETQIVMATYNHGYRIIRFCLNLWETFSFSRVGWV